MEGSGRSRVNSGAGRSSISDLFGRDPSAPQAGGSRCGDLFSTQGSYGDFQKEAFPAQASSHTQEAGCGLQLNVLRNLEAHLPVAVVSDHSQSIQVRGAFLSKGGNRDQ